MKKEDWENRLTLSEEAHHKKVAAPKLMRVRQSTRSNLTPTRSNSQTVKGVPFAIGMHMPKRHA